MPTLINAGPSEGMGCLLNVSLSNIHIPRGSACLAKISGVMAITPAKYETRNASICILYFFDVHKIGGREKSFCLSKKPLSTLYLSL